MLALALALILASAGCGDASPVADADVFDASDAGGDAADAPADALPDATDAGCDLSARSTCGSCVTSCGARNVCTAGACGCMADDVLCGTRGYATFEMPDPSRRGAPRPADYVEMGETVEDRATALVWQRTPSTTKVTYADAWSICAALALGGRDDFRLPSRVELVSILDPTRSPSIDTAIFPATPEDYFWTSSLVPGLDANAYGVYFGGGEVVTASQTVPGAFVRCVAGAVAPLPSPSHTVVGDAVQDESTDLLWSRAAIGPIAHADVTSACAAVDLGGAPARVPTINELATLVDESVHGPAVDRALFEGPTDGALWSSSTRDLGSVVVWALALDDGETVLVETTESHYLRCVR